MIKVSIEQAFKDLIELFELKDDKFKPKKITDSFMINKSRFERFEVINKLQAYIDANDTNGIDWCFSLSNITLVFTSFKIISTKN